MIARTNCRCFFQADEESTHYVTLKTSLINSSLVVSFQDKSPQSLVEHSSNFQNCFFFALFCDFLSTKWQNWSMFVNANTVPLKALSVVAKRKDYQSKNKLEWKIKRNFIPAYSDYKANNPPWFYFDDHSHCMMKMTRNITDIIQAEKLQTILCTFSRYEKKENSC